MVTRRGALRAILGACLALTVAPPAPAQEPPVQATVDRPVIRVNESFNYILRAEGAVRGEPEVAPLAAQFDILNSSSSRRIGIVNARTSELNEWQFQLMPKAAGELTIPSVRIGDRQSNPVSIRVLAPDPNASAAADIFMELTAAPDVIYAQAQVLFTLRLYVGVSTGRATLTAPDTTGVEAIVEKLGEDSSYQTTRGGRDFVVRERRYAVFPQQAGTLTIGPVTFEAMVIPDRGFSRVQRFRSDVLELTVLPAVAPPPGLEGATWLPARRVTLTEQWSEPGDELVVGIPRTRTIGVEGLGLLETQLPDVLLESQAGVRQYADRPELSREISGEGLLSRRTVSYAVIAQAPGDVTLRGIRLPWFNVTTQRWEVAELPTLPMRVTPSTDAAAPAPASDSVVTPAPAPDHEPNPWPWISAALALGWLATAALWWRARATPRSFAAKPPTAAAPKPVLRKILRDLDSACAVNDPDAARHALLAFGETRFTDNPPRSLGALAAMLPAGLAHEVLALEAHIYGAVVGAWRGDGLRALLGELEAAGAPPEPPRGDPLLPLYR